MMLYRSPNVVIDRHEWHVTVETRAGKIRRYWRFRPLSTKPVAWQPIGEWRGHLPKGRVFCKAFQPFKGHMLRAERSVVENARLARELQAA